MLQTIQCERWLSEKPKALGLYGLMVLLHSLGILADGDAQDDPVILYEDPNGETLGSAACVVIWFINEKA